MRRHFVTPLLMLAPLLLVGCGATFTAGTSIEGQSTIPVQSPLDGSIVEIDVGYAILLDLIDDPDMPGEKIAIYCAIITESPLGAGAVQPPFSHPRCLTANGGRWEPFQFKLVIPGPADWSPASEAGPDAEADSSPGDDSREDDPGTDREPALTEEPEPEPEPEPEVPTPSEDEDVAPSESESDP